MKNLEASFQLNFVGSRDRSRDSEKRVAMFQGLKTRSRERLLDRGPGDGQRLLIIISSSDLSRFGDGA